jgi:cation diffusion facilitator family transporter
VFEDALTSVLAIVALLASKYSGWNWMDPMMGIIGAIPVIRWSWHLLKDTSKVLLDEQHQDMEEAVKQAVEDDDAKVSDLHVWAIGPNIHAAIVSVVSHQPESPTVYKERIQAHCQSLVHVTVEPLRCD